MCLLIMLIGLLACLSLNKSLHVIECGRLRSYYDHKRIVGGNQVQPHEYSWVAYLMRKNRRSHKGNIQLCGGSVITNYYILTAGHCIKTLEYITMATETSMTQQPELQHYSSLQANEIIVVLGVHDRITMDNGRARIYKVSQVIVHPDYFMEIDANAINDIALLKLRREIKFNHFVRPICLPNRGEDFSRWGAIAVGWGRRGEDGPTRRYLWQVILKVLPHNVCAKLRSKHLYIKHAYQLICAYNKSGDACQADSGGPLFTPVRPHGVMVQIGIISAGEGCGLRRTPGIYTKVTHFLPWIYNMTADSTYCRKPLYQLWLEPKEEAYGPGYLSGRIQIALSFGNKNLRRKDGQQIGNNYLSCSVLMGEEPRTHETLRIDNQEGWYNDYHNYTVIWTPDNIIFEVDGKYRKELLSNSVTPLWHIMGIETYIYRGDSKIAPFNQEFYITLGLSAGGDDFPENSLNNGVAKPWNKNSHKCLLQFWRSRTSWLPTWQDDTAALYIASIKVTSL